MNSVFFSLAEFRSVAETCTVFPSIVPLLSSDQSDVRLQAMRAVGNLCIDHGELTVVIIIIIQYMCNIHVIIIIGHHYACTLSKVGQYSVALESE